MVRGFAQRRGARASSGSPRALPGYQLAGFGPQDSNRQDKGEHHVESSEAILAAQLIDPVAVDGPSRADPDFWSQSLDGRPTQRLVSRRSRRSGLHSVVGFIALDRGNGSLSIKSSGRLAARGVLFHRFSRAALFGLFPSRASGDGSLQ